MVDAAPGSTGRSEPDPVELKLATIFTWTGPPAIHQPNADQPSGRLCQRSEGGVRYYVQEVRVSTADATKARQNLFRLIDQVSDSHEPVLITGKKGSAVLVSESDWNAIEETLYLNSKPGMAASIRAGMETPASDLDDSLAWE